MKELTITCDCCGFQTKSFRTVMDEIGGHYKYSASADFSSSSSGWVVDLCPACFTYVTNEASKALRKMKEASA